jgi:multidrug efflux pump subunit AcrB
MPLGGLALAVGVLVDEATVSVENIHIQMRPGVSRAQCSFAVSPAGAVGNPLPRKTQLTPVTR